MDLLGSIRSPRDLDDLTPQQMVELAAEIRRFLVASVAKTGGHLGPNLGVVELTLAMHRVFDSPKDPIIFDTGHQSYVHKLLTGRQDFSHLRERGGLAGYPSAASPSTTSSSPPTRRRRCRGPTGSRAPSSSAGRPTARSSPSSATGRSRAG